MKRRPLTTPAGGLLTDARRRAGLTQRSLAALAGTSPSAIALYELGHRDPTVTTLSRLLRSCGMQLLMEAAPLTESDIAQSETDAAVGEDQAWKNADRFRHSVLSISPFTEG